MCISTDKKSIKFGAAEDMKGREASKNERMTGYWKIINIYKNRNGRIKGILENKNVPEM
jgi:hypothetical protein